MSENPDEPLNDDEITSSEQEPNSTAGGDADGTDGGSSEGDSTDSTDGGSSDADGTDGGSSDEF